MMDTDDKLNLNEEVDCLVCGKSFNTYGERYRIRTIMFHVSRVHKIPAKEYYQLIMGPNWSRPTCRFKECNKLTGYTTSLNGYRKFCDEHKHRKIGDFDVKYIPYKSKIMDIYNIWPATPYKDFGTWIYLSKDN